MIEMRRAQLSFGGGLIDCGRICIKNLSDALIRDQPACHGCLRLGTSTRHLHIDAVAGASAPSLPYLSLSLAVPSRRPWLHQAP